MRLRTGELAVLAGLPLMGPRRLRVLLSHLEPGAALDGLARRRSRRLPAHLAQLYTPELLDRWASVLDQEGQVEAALGTCRRLGIHAAAFGDPEYPAVLLADPLPPAVLFWRGDLDLLTRRRVAVIGTRHPTRSGLATAGVLAQQLAEAGVAVVSGLARGIDGAAHRGALSAKGPVIAVVGNGPDRPYPQAHRNLWEQVCAEGVLVSEWPPGTGPEAFRFPMRNRILAALSEVVVVVESRESGGSLSTVREAAQRGITVMAVPGSVHARASAGTNQLLCDGAPPVTQCDDVLVALGLHSARRSDTSHDPRPAVDARGARVMEVCRQRPSTLDDLCRSLGMPIGEVALCVARLERDGWVGESGGWIEVLGPWAGCPNPEEPEAIPYDP